MNITSHAIAMILGGAIVAGGCWWNSNKPSLPSVLAIPSEDLAKVSRRKIDCQPVIIYTDVAKKALGLPETVKADSKQQVLGATQVKPNDRPVTVSAVLDTGTGETSMYQRLDKRPWLAFDRRWRFGAFYGLSDSENGLFLGVAQYQFAQIKQINITAHGQADSSGRYFIGAGFSW